MFEIFWYSSSCLESLNNWDWELGEELAYYNPLLALLRERNDIDMPALTTFSLEALIPRNRTGIFALSIILATFCNKMSGDGPNGGAGKACDGKAVIADFPEATSIGIETTDAPFGDVEAFLKAARIVSAA